MEETEGTEGTVQEQPIGKSARSDNRPKLDKLAKAKRRFDEAKAHEWISFEDPDEERTWIFDVTFLSSSWHCIYGNGCPGIDEDPAPELALGCCSHGAHISDPEDMERVKKHVAKLTPDQWQFESLVKKPADWFNSDKQGERITRLIDGACIFLNRPGFPGGPGCALHRAALDAGEQPLDWKPEVCWQVPVRREDHEQPDGHVVSMIGQWDRKHWGEGGHDFGWWCTEEPQAFTSSIPVYIHSRSEIAALTSKSVYQMLASYLDERMPADYGDQTKTQALAKGAGKLLPSDSSSQPTIIGLLPHPVVRRRT